MDSNALPIMDARNLQNPIQYLNGHERPINTFCWAPHSAKHLCSASGDKQALIWDLGNAVESVEDPILAYQATGEVVFLQWSKLQPEWIGIVFENKLQILRV